MLRQDEWPQSNTDPSPQFFRVLNPDCRGIDGKPEYGTCHWWVQKIYRSSHCTAPFWWVQQWDKTKSNNPDDYDPNPPVDCARPTAEALAAYLRIMAQGEEMSAADQYLVGQYEGVSAFSDAKEALRYAEGTPLATFVVFTGTTVGKLPERMAFAIQVKKPL